MLERKIVSEALFQISPNYLCMGNACKRKATKRKQMTAALLCAEGSCPTPKIMGHKVRFFFFFLCLSRHENKEGFNDKELTSTAICKHVSCIDPKIFTFVTKNQGPLERARLQVSCDANLAIKKVIECNQRYKGSSTFFWTAITHFPVDAVVRITVCIYVSTSRMLSL